MQGEIVSSQPQRHPHDAGMIRVTGDPNEVHDFAALEAGSMSTNCRAGHRYRDRLAIDRPGRVSGARDQMRALAWAAQHDGPGGDALRVSAGVMGCVQCVDDFLAPYRRVGRAVRAVAGLAGCPAHMRAAGKPGTVPRVVGPGGRVE